MTPTESAALEHGQPEHGEGRQALPPPTPEQRLAASREAIRMALVSRHSTSARKARRRGRGLLGGLAQAFSHVPMSHLAQRYISRWWARHPWRTTVEFAVEATDELVRPMAEKHPWLLLGGALGVGALLSRARPWRWISGGALLAGVIPRMPLASVLDWVTSTLNDLAGQTEHPASPAAAGPEPMASEQTAEDFTPADDPPAHAPLRRAPAPAEDVSQTVSNARPQTLSPSQF